MRTARVRAARGFTLIELMTVVAIAGLLSSVAVPVFRGLNLRTRTAERAVIMGAISHAVNVLVFTRGGVPNGGWMFGLPNPAPAPSQVKHTFETARAFDNWRDLPLDIQGQTYYQYWFIATDVARPGWLMIQATGDVDGDGLQTVVTRNYVGAGAAFIPDPVNPQVPPVGFEDQFAF
jgi:prepilin-type N-terminal cleavage/methylation domain-containing protein